MGRKYSDLSNQQKMSLHAIPGFQIPEEKEFGLFETLLLILVVLGLLGFVIAGSVNEAERNSYDKAEAVRLK
jgi:hypothetical protein